MVVEWVLEQRRLVMPCGGESTWTTVMDELMFASTELLDQKTMVQIQQSELLVT
jgi:hypothetical protein